jgi:hypothetical protein
MFLPFIVGFEVSVSVYFDCRSHQSVDMFPLAHTVAPSASATLQIDNPDFVFELTMTASFSFVTKTLFSYACYPLRPNTSCTMTTRKGFIPPSLKPTSQTQAMSPEYLDALKVLSDETMSTAISLLLRDNDPDQGKSTSDQLLEIYNKCMQAKEVIDRETPPDLPFSSRALAPTSSLQAKQAKPGTKLSTTKPSTVTMMKPAVTIRGRLVRPAPVRVDSMKAKLQRLDSDSSMDRKKQPRTGDEAAPPPSALDFLAKLNKDTINQVKKQKNEISAIASKEIDSPPSPPPIQLPEEKPTRRNRPGRVENKAPTCAM